ncbi:hypothetical protein [Mameliella sp.]|uniref:hypothetical protein n=1 Tax=Mameliella sp. TaxID=1924940 RepID=UPI003BABB094
MSITTTKTAQAVMRGNPVSASYQPDPGELATHLQELADNGASSSDLAALVTRVSAAETGKADTSVTDALDTRLDAVEAAQTSGGIDRDPVAAWAGSNITLSGSQTVDGVTLSNGDRVGVGAQSDASENGVYTYSDSGAWTRAADMDASGEISLSTVFVSGGSTYGGHSYRFSVADPDTFVLDTDDITATQVGDVGALQGQIDLKAPLASPALTGTPTAPTATTGTDTTQIATTEFVQQELDASGALAFETFESLADDGPYLVDESGNIIADLSEAGEGVADAATVQAEVTGARGDAASLTERLDRGLTDYGDPVGPVLNAHRARNCRRKLRLIQQGESAQLVMALFGDSWTGGEYFRGSLAKALHDVFGIAGLGFVGFQFFGVPDAPPWVSGSNQPGGVKSGGGGAAILGCARFDLVPYPALSGSWTGVNAGPSANGTPSIGHVTSSTAGDQVSFSWSGATHDGADLYYPGLNAGVVRYSWDGGATWEASLNLTAGGPAKVALSNVPGTSSGSLVFDVVSGTVDLSGVDLKSTADGVRFHALSAPGSNSSHWAVDVDPAEWAATAITDMGIEAFAGILAGNDQSGGVPAATVAANAEAIMAALRAVSSTADLIWITQAELDRASAPAVPMADYTAAARKKAVDNGWTFIDLQAAFGDDVADYKNGSALGLLDSSGTHPSRPAGGMAITDAILRVLAPYI